MSVDRYPKCLVSVSKYRLDTVIEVSTCNRLP